MTNPNQRKRKNLVPIKGPEPGTSGLEKTAPSGELESSSRSN